MRGRKGAAVGCKTAFISSFDGTAGLLSIMSFSMHLSAEPLGRGVVALTSPISPRGRKEGESA